MTDSGVSEQLSRIHGVLGELQRKVAQLGMSLDAVEGRQEAQATLLGQVESLITDFDDLLRRFNALFPPLESNGEKFYSPKPTPRFWSLEGEDRAKAVARIRLWVDRVYVPVFGHLAVALPPCWDQHPLCLTILDVLMELHGVHFLQPTRNQGLLTGQAELLSRMLPALADLMRAEQKVNCTHQPQGLYAANGRAS